MRVCLGDCVNDQVHRCKLSIVCFLNILMCSQKKTEAGDEEKKVKVAQKRRDKEIRVARVS